jgi:hypothetical protein
VASRGRRSNVTVKDQYYSYQAKRSWFDSDICLQQCDLDDRP